MENDFFITVTLPLFQRRKFGDRTVTYITYFNRDGWLTTEEVCDDQDDPEWIQERLRLISAEHRAFMEKKSE